MPLHAAVHVPVCVLHGAGTEEGALRVPAGAARGRDRKFVLENREGRNDGQGRPREPDGHCGKTAGHTFKRLFGRVIF